MQRTAFFQELQRLKCERTGGDKITADGDRTTQNDGMDPTESLTGLRNCFEYLVFTTSTTLVTSAEGVMLESTNNLVTSSEGMWDKQHLELTLTHAEDSSGFSLFRR